MRRRSFLQTIAGLATAPYLARGASAARSGGVPIQVRAAKAREAYLRFGIPEATLAYDTAADDDVARVRAVVETEAGKYPATFFERAKMVWVVEGLSISTCPVGGTYSGDTVILSTRFGTEGAAGCRVATETELAEIFHAELSSIVLSKDSECFPRDQWLREAPAGFAYAGDGLDAVRRGAAQMFPQCDGVEQGFLSQYALASIEEDVNAYAIWMMYRPNDLRMFSRRVGAVARKAKLLRDFYLGIDGSFGARFPPALWQ
jgi:hypothetical protein